jgi:UDP-2,3-diacylglucosamine hydrolase
LSTLFISDLHLPAQPSTLRDVFIQFLEGPALKADALYILGDLFEYWIGDDVGLQTYAREVSRLAALTARGVPVYFQHGNRDFLVGSHFAQISGVHILPDPSVIDLYGQPTLISHGDLFCTDDVGYQRWRGFSRNAIAQWCFLRLPVSWRERVAGEARSQSNKDKSHKLLDIMDVNAMAITAAFETWDIKRMIHGHTHRPADHDDEHGRQRIVLADWTMQRMEALAVDAGGIRHISLLS